MAAGKPHAAYRPSVERSHVRVRSDDAAVVGRVEARSAIVHERIIIGRAIVSEPGEQGSALVSGARETPERLRAETTAQGARAGLRFPRDARLEEHRAADAELVGFERRVRAVDLD